MKRVEEGAGELVISRGDSAVDLQLTDHALDAVALAIHAPVPADFGLAIGFGRNAGTDAGRTDSKARVQVLRPLRAKAATGQNGAYATFAPPQEAQELCIKLVS